MDRERRSGLRRFASATLIAAPVTMALLFIMTRLILPRENDRIISRMIQDIEFVRSVRSPAVAEILVFKPPQKPAETTVEVPRKSQDITTAAEEFADESERAAVIDWWAQARALTQETDEGAFKRWLLEQGYDRYVSIMQGPVPITNSVHATLPDTQEDATGYMNSFGDMEYKINENCVATTQVAARFDHSDFAKNMPMRITCKPAAKQRFSFDRHWRAKIGAPM